MKTYTLRMPNGKQYAMTDDIIREMNEMIDALADVKIACATLEKEYLAKFKSILPAKKLMRVQMAEDRFQRELLKGIRAEKR